MKLLLERFFSALMILACFSICKGCAKDYFTGPDEKKVAMYRKMITDQTIAEATLENEYTETESEIFGVSIMSYEFKYNFKVKNRTYNGTHTFSDVPTT